MERDAAVIAVWLGLPIVTGLCLWLLSRNVIGAFAHRPLVAAGLFVGGAPVIFVATFVLAMEFLRQYFDFGSPPEGWGLLGVAGLNAVTVLASLPIFLWTLLRRRRRIRPY